MIPKIIHYCWFGGNPKPQEVLDYIETWKKYLPEYEIKEWNESNFDYKSIKYTREAYFAKKYAFVSDVCRMYALYTEGGIYFDTDIEVIGAFSKYENMESFIGYEAYDLVGTGVIGAQKGVVWIKSFLDTYKQKDFIFLDGTINNVPNTQLLTNFLNSTLLEDRPAILPIEVLCAKNWESGQLCNDETTIAIHHYRNSWSGNRLYFDAKEMSFCAKLHLPCYHILAHLYKWLSR